MHRGQLIQDRYELSAPIGSGGMAEVWCATDRRLDRDVAVKFLAPRLAGDPEFLVRFFSEAQCVARINHPAVVSVLDFGEAEDRPYLVMEYVPGGSAADLVGTAIAVERALELVAEAASGAGAAHEAGLVHRDVKPANILIDEGGHAKIADFGISSSETGERLTATGAAIGSPHYISPEQVSGRAASPASDVYSLGIVLYELITGRKPFDGENVTAVAISHVEDSPEPVSTHVPDLDPAVDALVMRCLSKNPKDRFADGAALAAAIELVMSGDDDPYALLPYDEEDTTADDRGPRVLLPTLVIIVLLGLTSLGVLASTSADTPGAAPTQSPSPLEKSRKKDKPSPSPSLEAQTTSVSAPAPSPSPSASPEVEKEKVKDEPEEEPVDEEPEPEQTTAEPSPTPEEPEPSPTAAP